MADIFISYSKDEPEPTIALARDLERNGYSTWWDTDLRPGERYQERIMNELDKAKAVIVIWTAKSVTSRWVVAEAEWAAEQNKLITVRTPDLNPDRIPLPFNTLHTDVVTDREKINDALFRSHVFPQRRIPGSKKKKASLRDLLPSRRDAVSNVILACAILLVLFVGIQIFTNAQWINYHVVGVLVANEHGFPLNGRYLLPEKGFAIYMIFVYVLFLSLLATIGLYLNKTRGASIEELRGLRQDFDDTVRFASNITGYMFPSGDRDVPRFDIIDVAIKHIIRKNGDTDVDAIFELDCVTDPAHLWIYWIEADAESGEIRFIRQLNFQVIDLATGQRLDWLLTSNSANTKILAIFFPEIRPGTRKTLRISYTWPGYMRKLIVLGATNFEWRYLTQNAERRARFRTEWEFDQHFAPLECRIIGHRSETASVRLDPRGNKFAWIYEDPSAVLKSKYAVEFFDRHGGEN